ncbi:transposase [Streptomyces sp. NPDC048349]|uniref:transposase n=1 Tax=Streptomyces sp. NPDC048349 TaxID=3155486 RepID=UPI003413E53C
MPADSSLRGKDIYRPRFPPSVQRGSQELRPDDYRDLAVRAHIQLGGPIVLVWDDLNTHLAAGMKRYAAEHDWLTVFQLPSYSPDLDLVEGIGLACDAARWGTPP